MVKCLKCSKDNPTPNILCAECSAKNARVIAINIDEELEAMKRGECGMCRIGATHIVNDTCTVTPEKEYPMVTCFDCTYRWCTKFFNRCPICKPK